MATKKSSKPLEPDYVSDMINTGSTKLAKENADVFTGQLLGASFQTFQKALEVLKQDAEFRATVFDKLFNEYREAYIVSAAMSNRVMDDAAANTDLVRRLIEKIVSDGQVQPGELDFLFGCLKYWHDRMEQTQREDQAAQERMLAQERQATEVAAESSGLTDFLATVGIGTLIFETGKWLFNTFINNNKRG